MPRHPGFLELALQHQYPLRSLITPELPNCALGPYLAKVQGGGMRFDDLLAVATVLSGRCIDIVMCRKIKGTVYSLKWDADTA